MAIIGSENGVKSKAFHTAIATAIASALAIAAGVINRPSQRPNESVRIDRLELELRDVARRVRDAEEDVRRLSARAKPRRERKPKPKAPGPRHEDRKPLP